MISSCKRSLTHSSIRLLFLYKELHEEEKKDDDSEGCWHDLTRKNETEINLLLCLYCAFRCSYSNKTLKVSFRQRGSIAIQISSPLAALHIHRRERIYRQAKEKERERAIHLSIFTFLRCAICILATKSTAHSSSLCVFTFQTRRYKYKNMRCRNGLIT